MPVTMLLAVDSFAAFSRLGGGIILLAGVLTALGVIGRKLWRAARGAGRMYQLGHAAFETIVGTAEHLGISDRISQVERELRPNGGGSLRDAVDQGTREARAAVTEAQRVGAITEELRGYAEANRNGIAELRQGQATVDQRITDHRRRNDEQILALRDYLESDRQELLLAKQGLEAAVTELLMVDAHETRPQPLPASPGPDHEPDL